MAHLESLRQTNKICNMQIQYFFCMHCWEEFRRKIQQYEEIIISLKKKNNVKIYVCHYASSFKLAECTAERTLTVHI